MSSLERLNKALSAARESREREDEDREDSEVSENYDCEVVVDLEERDDGWYIVVAESEADGIEAGEEYGPYDTVEDAKFATDEIFGAPVDDPDAPEPGDEE